VRGSVEASAAKLTGGLTKEHGYVSCSLTQARSSMSCICGVQLRGTAQPRGSTSHRLTVQDRPKGAINRDQPRFHFKLHLCRGSHRGERLVRTHDVGRATPHGSFTATTSWAQGHPRDHASPQRTLGNRHLESPAPGRPPWNPCPTAGSMHETSPKQRAPPPPG
jgi:hypothetical protein